jgi:hypothetical protein
LNFGRSLELGSIDTLEEIGMADRSVDVRTRGRPNSHGKLVKVLDRVQGRVRISLLIGKFDLSVSIKNHDRSEIGLLQLGTRSRSDRYPQTSSRRAYLFLEGHH